MKILHVETGRHFLGGPQQVIYLINGLRDAGHENLLVCPPGSGIDNAARVAGIRVHNLFCAGDLDLPFAYRLTQFVSEEGPDLVHCHSRRGADMLGGRAAAFADVPAVVSRRVDNTEMRLLATLRYQPFAKVIAISEAIAAMLREHGVDASRIETIRSAVDAASFAGTSDRQALRVRYGLGADALLILAAGQLIPRKGHRYLLQAFAQLAPEHPQAHLIICGDGPLEAELRQQAVTAGIADVVHFDGFRDDLDDELAAFDLLAHPALSEGLGVATLKAAAAGLPVVGFEAGGLPEAVEHGATGLLVPVEDSAALQDALASLIADANLRIRMGAAGRQRMQSEFSIATMVNRHIALYEDVLNG